MRLVEDVEYEIDKDIPQKLEDDAEVISSDKITGFELIPALIPILFIAPRIHSFKKRSQA